MRQRHDTLGLPQSRGKLKEVEMSPGPLTSRQHGGHGFGPRFHGHGYGRIAPPAPRTHFAERQRFNVATSADGGSTITLDENETVTVGTDVDGAVTITVNPKPPENGNGLGNGTREMPARRSLFGRTVDRMAVSSNSDGSVTIRPEGDAALQIVGDPLSGAVTVVEIEPVPIPENTPNAQ
jgi:hypothetical protein